MSNCIWWKNLEYNPDTGEFRWSFKQEKFHNRRPPGELCGSCDSNGYLQLNVGGKIYQAHRVAWFLVTGKWPKDQIDHKDKNQLNNKFENLRESNNRQNANNRVSSRKIPGVRLAPSGRYTSRIRINYKEYHLGTFDTEEKAFAAYLKKAAEIKEAPIHV